LLARSGDRLVNAGFPPSGMGERACEGGLFESSSADGAMHTRRTRICFRLPQCRRPAEYLFGSNADRHPQSERRERVLAFGVRREAGVRPKPVLAGQETGLLRCRGPGTRQSAPAQARPERATKKRAVFHRRGFRACRRLVGVQACGRAHERGVSHSTLSKPAMGHAAVRRGRRKRRSYWDAGPTQVRGELRTGTQECIALREPASREHSPPLQ